jgi:predicted metal-dependent hydrolase
MVIANDISPYAANGINKYWAGGHGRYNSFILTALLATVPVFEKFLCRSMSLLSEKYSNNKTLLAYAAQLQIEESEHIRVHEQLFRSLQELGYPVSDIAQDTQAWIDGVEDTAFEEKIAFVVMSEYNIASACRCILKGHPMYEGGHRPWLDYQLQHAREEVDHYVLSLAIARALKINFWTFLIAYCKFSYKGIVSFIKAVRYIQNSEDCSLSDKAKFWLYWYRTQCFSRNPVFLIVTLKSMKVLYDVYIKSGIEKEASRHLENHRQYNIINEFNA